MTVFVCVDEDGGMQFHRRRQSRDRTVTADILQMCAGRRLWMNASSRTLFPEEAAIETSPQFLDCAGAEDCCFVEDVPLLPVESRIDTVVRYCWNRRYPSDRKLDLSLTEPTWHLVSADEFPGFSHERIGKEVYSR